jgi:hypothetical protein
VFTTTNEEFAEIRDAVQRGDTEWLVAYLCGVSVEDIRRVGGVDEALKIRRAELSPSSSTDRAQVS